MSPSATTQNNLETSDVGKSEHFSVAASLLEVSHLVHGEIIGSSAVNNIMINPCLLCAGEEVCPGHQFDPPQLHDQQREGHQTPEL